MFLLNYGSRVTGQFLLFLDSPFFYKIVAALVAAKLHYILLIYTFFDPHSPENSY